MPMCGGVKWKNMMFTASSVRTPVSAGSGGLRKDAADWTGIDAGASGGSRALGTVTSLDEDFGVRGELGRLDSHAGVRGDPPWCQLA